jgi:hypothetical protein
MERGVRTASGLAGQGQESGMDANAGRTDIASRQVWTGLAEFDHPGNGLGIPPIDLIQEQFDPLRQTIILTSHAHTKRNEATGGNAINHRSSDAIQRYWLPQNTARAAQPKDDLKSLFRGYSEVA